MGIVWSLQPLEEPPRAQYFGALKGSLPRMDGKTVAITGCTSGTGFICAKTCCELGARVVMLNRQSERAEAALQTFKGAGMDAVMVACDLTSFGSVAKAAQEMQRLCADGVDVLCNNAGVMAFTDTATVDGCDVQMQSNHLSHFLLTSELWSLLELAATKRGEARVVNHSSGARLSPAKELTAAYLGRNGGQLGGDRWPGIQKWQRYQQSKLANLLFTYALHDRAQQHESKTRALCAHPGPTYSGLQERTEGGSMLDNYINNTAMRKAHSVEDGSMGIVRCCCEVGVESGQFYGPAVPGRGGPAVLLEPERNVEAERMLWEESCKTTGATLFSDW